MWQIKCFKRVYQSWYCCWTRYSFWWFASSQESVSESKIENMGKKQKRQIILYVSKESWILTEGLMDMFHLFFDVTCNLANYTQVGDEQFSFVWLVSVLWALALNPASVRSRVTFRWGLMSGWAMWLRSSWTLSSNQSRNSWASCWEFPLNWSALLDTTFCRAKDKQVTSPKALFFFFSLRCTDYRSCFFSPPPRPPLNLHEIFSGSDHDDGDQHNPKGQQRRGVNVSQRRGESFLNPERDGAEESTA